MNADALNQRGNAGNLGGNEKSVRNQGVMQGIKMERREKSK